jgi:hypothetical protein
MPGRAAVLLSAGASFKDENKAGKTQVQLLAESAEDDMQGLLSQMKDLRV